MPSPPTTPIITCSPVQLSFINGADKQIQAQMQRNGCDFSMLISLLQEVLSHTTWRSELKGPYEDQIITSFYK